MEELNKDILKDLENIEIPEGLEERLSMKIDQWEMQEKKVVPMIPKKVSRIMTYISAAACFVLLFGVGVTYLNADKSSIKEKDDTYDDPVVAQKEAERALALLAYNLNKGVGQMEKAKAISDRVEITWDKSMNIK